MARTPLPGQLTVRQARDGIYSTFDAFWDDPECGWRSIEGFGDTPPLRPEPIIRYENVRQEETAEPQPLEPWINFSVRHNDTVFQGFGGPDLRGLYEGFGVVILQIFTPIGCSLTLADDMVNVAKGALQGTRGTGEFCSLVFRGATVNEIGVDDKWHQTNVIVPFEYDEAF